MKPPLLEPGGHAPGLAPKKLDHSRGSERGFIIPDQLPANRQYALAFSVKSANRLRAEPPDIFVIDRAGSVPLSEDPFFGAHLTDLIANDSPPILRADCSYKKDLTLRYDDGTSLHLDIFSRTKEALTAFLIVKTMDQEY